MRNVCSIRSYSAEISQKLTTDPAKVHAVCFLNPKLKLVQYYQTQLSCSLSLGHWRTLKQNITSISLSRLKQNFFETKNFDMYGYQLILTDTANLNHHDTYSLCKKWSFIGYKSVLSQNSYDVDACYNDDVFC